MCMCVCARVCVHACVDSNDHVSLILTAALNGSTFVLAARSRTLASGRAGSSL